MDASIEGIPARCIQSLSSLRDLTSRGFFKSARAKSLTNLRMVCKLLPPHGGNWSIVNEEQLQEITPSRSATPIKRLGLAVIILK